MQMSKQQLILLPSDKMDNNKKEGRNERALIRMPAASRDFLGFNKKAVEIWAADSTKDRLKTSVSLKPFQAYTTDIRRVKKMIADGELQEKDRQRVAFVTTEMYNRLQKFERIWGSSTVADTVIGADPEFLLRSKAGEIIKANNIPGFGGYTPVGSDGPMAEIRPDPALTPGELVSNIKKLLSAEDTHDKIGEYDWLALAYLEDNNRDYPIGSHIHFGNPALIASLAPDKRKRLFKVVTRILDELIAVPLIKLDGVEGKNRRTNCVWAPNEGGFGNGRGLGYGYFGDTRVCDGRMEYRTLSGKIHSSPELLELVYGVSKMIVDSAFTLFVEEGALDDDYYNPKDCQDKDYFCNTFDSWGDIGLTKDIDCVMTSRDLRAKLHNGDARLITVKYLNGWLKHLQILPKFNEGEVYVKELFKFLKRKASTLKSIESNMKKTWLKESK